MNLALWLFSAVTFTAFLLFVCFKYRIQNSISASIHVLQGPFEKSLYSWFILCVAIPMMIISDTTIGWWAGAILALDFAAPSGGEKLQSFLHSFGAGVGMALGMLMLYSDFNLHLLVVLTLIFIAFALNNLRHSTWWIEVGVYVAVMIGLFFTRVL